MGNNPYRNGEGYIDKTAGMAIKDVDRERRKAMKKQSCRRTKDEKRVHDEAVKLRHMSDKQLVEHIDQQKQKAKEAGYKEGCLNVPNFDIRTILKRIASVKGIGELKMVAIEEILVDELGGRA